MKYASLYGGILLLLFTSFACSKNEPEVKNEKPMDLSQKLDIDSEKHFGILPMHKLCAMKAFKLPNENNPITNLKFSADPAVLVYGDTVYLYATNDSQQMDFSLGQADNGFEKINTLNVYSSKDLVNWTYEGEIPVAGKNNPEGPAKWATNSWAPAVCTNKVDGKEKVFLYFADSGNGIGVLSSDSPTGPFIDPIGKPLISRQTPNTEGVWWLFDPAVMVDDDGKGYLYYGGGVQSDPVHPKSARCVALGDDMVSIVGTPITLDPPYLFEDSGINKINGKYVYSYCTNWTDRGDAKGPEVSPIAVIAYMTSDKPLGPFKYQGYFLKNPASYYGPSGNNHHWVFYFNNRYYVAYHAQVVEKQIGLEKGGYRNLFINELEVNADGSIPIQEKISKEGVAPVCDFNPHTTIAASTMHSAKKMVVTASKTIVPVEDGAYVMVKNVAFTKKDCKVTVKAGEKSVQGEVSFKIGNSVGGKELARFQINGAGDYTQDITLPADLSGNINLYIVINGIVELESWSF